MLRLAFIALVLCIFCRWAVGKWPWEYLRSSSARSKALQRARRLLGVDANAGRDDVIAAHRRLVAMVHPDRGGTTQAMQEANAARDLLLADLPGAVSRGADDNPPPSSPD